MSVTDLVRLFVENIEPYQSFFIENVMVQIKNVRKCLNQKQLFYFIITLMNNACAN